MGDPRPVRSDSRGAPKSPIVPCIHSLLAILFLAAQNFFPNLPIEQVRDRRRRPLALIAWWRVSFPFARLMESLNMGELAKRHYVALALLAVVAAGHQALVARDIFHGILHPES